jgi:methylation protein EvaC
VGFCASCGMVQLLGQPPRDMMFHDHYPFFSSLSAGMVRHFGDMAAYLRRTYLTSERPFVVELGCNDGVMLGHMAQAGIRHLGVEPSANVAARARVKGIQVVTRFFDDTLADEILAEHGRAAVIVAANVLCHLPYQHSVLGGVRRLLAPDGVFVVEDPYLGDIVAKTAYDQIYDEHACYFSLLSIEHLLVRHELEVIDVMPQAVHGGSMRYVISPRGARPISPAVSACRALERQLGLHRTECYDGFRVEVERSRDLLMTLLERLHREGRRVVGYGATSKSTTVINYCGITPALVEFITDTTPEKQGTYSPGAHIPVRAHAEFVGRYPDYALLFAWNHAAEIIAKEDRFIESGGRWIIYVPAVHVSADSVPAGAGPTTHAASGTGARRD